MVIIFMDNRLPCQWIYNLSGRLNAPQPGDSGADPRLRTSYWLISWGRTGPRSLCTYSLFGDVTCSLQICLLSPWPGKLGFQKWDPETKDVVPVLSYYTVHIRVSGGTSSASSGPPGNTEAYLDPSRLNWRRSKYLGLTLDLQNQTFREWSLCVCSTTDCHTV